MLLCYQYQYNQIRIKIYEYYIHSYQKKLQLNHSKFRLQLIYSCFPHCRLTGRHFQVRWTTWHTDSRSNREIYIQSYFVFSYPEPHRAAAVQELRYWCRGYTSYCFTSSFVDENLERKRERERDRERGRERKDERERKIERIRKRQRDRVRQTDREKDRKRQK